MISKTYVSSAWPALKLRLTDYQNRSPETDLTDITVFIAEEAARDLMNQIKCELDERAEERREHQHAVGGRDL